MFTKLIHAFKAWRARRRNAKSHYKYKNLNQWGDED